MAAPDSEPSSSNHTIPLHLIAALSMANIGFTGARLGLTLTAVYLQASTFEVGAILSLIMVVATFISVPVGRWADRAVHATPTFIGLGLFALACLIAGLWTRLPGLALGALLFGSGYMLPHVAVNNAIGQAAGVAYRARAFGLMAMGFSFAAVIGPMLVGRAIDHGSHSLAFMLLALSPLAAAALLLRERRLPVRHPARPAASDAVAARRGRVFDLLRDPSMRAVYIVGGIANMAWDLFIFLMPLHASRSGLSASQIGVVAGGFGIGSFVVRLAIPWLMRHLDEWGLLGASLVATTLGFVLAPFATSFASLLVLAFALGMVLGIGQPLSMSLVHVAAPPSRTGEAVGLRATITSISQTALPLLFGGLGAAVGMMPVFWCAAALMAGGSVYAVRDRRRRAR